MSALVVFETLWGNSERIAREIARGIDEATTQVVEASSAPSILDPRVGLLVVGGPTHTFSLPTATTRESARQQGAEHIPPSGIREWIEALQSPPRTVHVATFDTRVVRPRLPGSAARKAMKRLAARGYHPLAEPETFRVHGYSGPLAEGEIERARRWGSALAERATAG